MLFLLLFALQAQAEPCREILGALDIGSGSVKAFVAQADVCEKRLLETLYEEDAPFPCNEALGKAADGALPPSFLAEAAPRVAELVKRAKEKGATAISARATSCLRRASNGAAVAAELSKTIGMPVRVITQEEEAELGFLSAMAAHHVAPDDEVKVVVWDIGSGSMQMEAATIGENQEYRGSLASVGFKNRVLEEILKKDPSKQGSPNPLGAAWPKAVALAEKHARRTVPAFFKNLKGKRRWLGIGGTLALSVQKQVGEKAHAFTRQELERTLKERASFKDEALGSFDPATQVTNLALVLGYMKALKIDRVETAHASLNQGALTQEAFRPARSAVPATGAEPLPVKKPVAPAPAPMAQ